MHPSEGTERGLARNYKRHVVIEIDESKLPPPGELLVPPTAAPAEPPPAPRR